MQHSNKKFFLNDYPTDLLDCFDRIMLWKRNLDFWMLG